MSSHSGDEEPVLEFEDTLPLERETSLPYSDLGLRAFIGPVLPKDWAPPEPPPEPPPPEEPPDDDGDKADKEEPTPPEEPLPPPTCYAPMPTCYRPMRPPPEE